MSATSTVPPVAVGGDEEAWLYESKDADGPPPGDDSSQEPVLKRAVTFISIQYYNVHIHITHYD